MNDPRSKEWTPTYEVVLDAVTFPRNRLGEPRDMTREQFDRWLNLQRANAIRNAATGFIDWDVMYGHEPETAQYREDMKSVEYLNREADKIQAGDYRVGYAEKMYGG